MKIGYANGHEAGYNLARSEFERILSILREEVSDLRRDRDLQLARADAAADLLLQHIGARAISLAGKHEEAARRESQIKNTTALMSMGDPTEDLPYGHPNALYNSKRDASLFADLESEDVTSENG